MLDDGESVVRITVFLSILIDVSPLVFDLALSVNARMSDGVKVSLVTWASRLASYLTDRAFRRIVTFITLFAVILTRLLIDVKEVIGFT